MQKILLLAATEGVPADVFVKVRNELDLWVGLEARAPGVGIAGVATKEDGGRRLCKSQSQKFLGLSRHLFMKAIEQGVVPPGEETVLGVRWCESDLLKAKDRLGVSAGSDRPAKT